MQLNQHASHASHVATPEADATKLLVIKQWVGPSYFSAGLVVSVTDAAGCTFDLQQLAEQYGSGSRPSTVQPCNGRGIHETARSQAANWERWGEICGVTLAIVTGLHPTSERR